MKLAFCSTTFGPVLPDEYQGSHRPEEPLDIMYASSAAQAFAECQIVSIWSEINLESFDAVVLSTTNSYLQWNNHPLGLDLISRSMSELLRRGARNIVIFGPHVPAHFDELYKLGATAVFVGEAELVAGQAAFRIAQGQPIDHMDGFVPRGSITLPKPVKIENLDQLPLPDWKGVLSKDYWAHNHPNDESLSGHLYEASRGCPFFCSFCNTITHRRKYRKKSPNKIIRDLLHLSQISSKRYVYFIDESFSADGEWITELAPQLKTLGFKFGCQGNLKFLSKEKIVSLADAGFISLEFGFETANDDLLKNIGKDNRLDTAATLLNFACESGISPLLFTLIGLPEEAPATLRRTLDFFATLDPRVRISIGMPTPYMGTRLYKQGIKEGKIDPFARGAALYAYTGRIGHGLHFTDQGKKRFLSQWGPNHNLTPENIELLNRDISNLFDLDLYTLPAV